MIIFILFSFIPYDAMANDEQRIYPWADRIKYNKLAWIFSVC